MEPNAEIINLDPSTFEKLGIVGVLLFGAIGALAWFVRQQSADLKTTREEYVKALGTHAAKADERTAQVTTALNNSAAVSLACTTEIKDMRKDFSDRLDGIHAAVLDQSRNGEQHERTT